MKTSIAAAVLLLVTGCGSQVGPASSSSPSAGPTVAGRCPSAAELMPQGVAGNGTVPLADDVSVTAAVECVVEQRPVAGDGVWSFVVEKRATARLDHLATALREKDEPTPADQACALVLVVVPWFAVVDARGTWVRPHVPATSCGDPQPAVMSALDALVWTTVSATRTTQLTTEAQAKRDAAAAAAGCATPFKDMIAIEEADKAPTSRSDRWPPIDAAGSTVCRYTAGVDTEGMPSLTFASGHRATGARATAIAAALSATGPVQPCTARHRAVTVLTTSGGAWYLVEDDGCHRLLDGDHSVWGQATPDLLTALR